MKIAIVVSEFNSEVTSKMLKVALARAKALGITVSRTSHVPGAFDMPIVVDALLARNDVDAVVTLGAIIKGQTKHDELIANVTARTLVRLSLRHKKPVSLGITGPGMTDAQAIKRIAPVSERAVEAAQKLYLELKKL
ncbi:MAG TPA: 6,7-dimethyl-8-ribityllumazine synthase [Candidatus Baltobacteraceae bacterium]|nr:6,7-dimethyl-8-ribityllumazine synthase [Candidatus Baltobacteraceae bacterium]